MLPVQPTNLPRTRAGLRVSPSAENQAFGDSEAAGSKAAEGEAMNIYTEIISATSLQLKKPEQLPAGAGYVQRMKIKTEDGLFEINIYSNEPIEINGKRENENLS